MNNCNFIGILQNDPILDEVERDNGTKTALVRFTIAIPRTFKKKSSGEVGKENTYINCEAWDSGAVVIANRFRRGDTIILYCSARNEVSCGHIYFRVDKFEFSDILVEKREVS